MIEGLLKRIRQFPTQFFLIIIGALLFIPFLGYVHLFDWDEINFAESAREMLLTHNYRMVQINFEPFYEKPPFFIWLQALSMHYCGVTEFAARLPNAICGIVTLVVVFNAGGRIFNSQFGVLWALMFACSILPQMYFKSGIIDPVFNLFIFLGIYYIFKLTISSDFENSQSRRRNRRINLILSALYIGLATLTKGPVAILLVTITITTYFIINRGKMKIELSETIAWWLIVSAVVLAWLSFELRSSGFVFLREFMAYQIRLFSTEDAGHGGPFFYHFIVLLIGVFPASAFIFDSFRQNDYDDLTQTLFKRWMIYLLCVVLIVFSVVKTKIIHYSSLCYFPITFLAAYYLNYLLDGKMKWTWRQTLPLFTICLLIVIGLIGGIIAIQQPNWIMDYVKDEFARECLQAKVYWSTADIRFPIAYLVLVITGIFLIDSKRIRLGVFVIIISSALFINKVMSFIVPRVELYSQGALIEFCESKKNEDCVIETGSFKSYAPFFYAAKRIPEPGDTSKPHYVIIKVNGIENEKKSRHNLTELYRKNGMVFFKQN